uniref:Uncharacterized protein n=1 Tax=Anguilla anguilla TaxID=7936 RepID=A0A0E9UY48_ANGAN
MARRPTVIEASDEEHGDNAVRVTELSGRNGRNSPEINNHFSASQI